MCYQLDVHSAPLYQTSRLIVSGLRSHSPYRHPHFVSLSPTCRHRHTVARLASRACTHQWDHSNEFGRLAHISTHNCHQYIRQLDFCILGYHILFTFRYVAWYVREVQDVFVVHLITIWCETSMGCGRRIARDDFRAWADKEKSVSFLIILVWVLSTKSSYATEGTRFIKFLWSSPTSLRRVHQWWWMTF